MKGSQFAADRGRYYISRGRSFRTRGGFRSRGPPRDGAGSYGGGDGGGSGSGGGGQMIGGRGGGGYRGRGRPIFRRRFYRQVQGRPGGQQQQVSDGSGVEGQQQDGNNYQQSGDGNTYEQRQSRGRPRRYIQRFFRRRPRRPRDDNQGGGGGDGSAGEGEVCDCDYINLIYMIYLLIYIESTTRLWPFE